MGTGSRRPSGGVGPVPGAQIPFQTLKCASGCWGGEGEPMAPEEGCTEGEAVCSKTSPCCIPGGGPKASQKKENTQ